MNPRTLTCTCYPQFLHITDKGVLRPSPPTIIKASTDKDSAFKNVNKDGLYVWDSAQQAYAAEDPYKHNSLPVKAADVPVATLVGTLASSTFPEANQIYPPRFSNYGNVFDHIDPFTTKPVCDPEGAISHQNSCVNGVKVSSSGTLDACRKDVQGDSRCKKVMYSPSQSKGWGCYCCTTEAQQFHNYWSIYDKFLSDEDANCNDFQYGAYEMPATTPS